MCLFYFIGAVISYPNYTNTITLKLPNTYRFSTYDEVFHIYTLPLVCYVNAQYVFGFNEK